MRVSGSFPPAIQSRESPAAAGLAAIIRPSQELSRFAEPTFTDFVAPGNTKTACRCEEPVDDENSLWKTEENLEGICSRRDAAPILNDLHIVKIFGRGTPLPVTATRASSLRIIE